jgi:hypothetical protein
MGAGQARSVALNRPGRSALKPRALSHFTSKTFSPWTRTRSREIRLAERTRVQVQRVDLDALLNELAKWPLFAVDREFASRGPIF